MLDEIRTYLGRLSPWRLLGGVFGIAMILLILPHVQTCTEDFPSSCYAKIRGRSFSGIAGVTVQAAWMAFGAVFVVLGFTPKSDEDQ